MVGSLKEKSRKYICREANGTLLVAFMRGYCKEFVSLQRIIWLAHRAFYTIPKAWAF